MNPSKEPSAHQGACWSAIIALACLTSFAVAEARAQVPDWMANPPGLVGWWRGEGDATDTLGLNNGTVQGGCSFVPGEVGQSFNFDGFSGSVVIPDSSSLHLSRQFTLEAWINSSGAAFDHSILSKVGAPGGVGNAGYQLGLLQDNRLIGNFNSYIGQAWPMYSIVSPNPIALGSWNHVVFTYDQNRMNLYLNGQLINSLVIGAHPVAATTNRLFIGLTDNNELEHFHGQIDEAKIYNVALPAGQIHASYDAGIAAKSPPPQRVNAPGLVGWWRGEDDAQDVLGLNPGTLQGGIDFAPGKIGQAFRLDGIGGNVVVPDSSSLRLTRELTLEAWINPAITNGDRDIIDKIGDPPFNRGYQLVLSGNSLVGQFNSPGQPWPAEVVTCPIPIVLGAWNHVAFTYNQSAMTLYFNGRPVATNVVGAFTIDNCGNNLRIGSDDGHHNYFKGMIDEARVYNVALSAARIQADYNASRLPKLLGAIPPRNREIVTTAPVPPLPDATAMTGIIIESPLLRASVSAAGDLELSWPGSAVGYALESSADLANWTGVSAVVSSDGISFSVTVPNTDSVPRTFYRLHRQ